VKVRFRTLFWGGAAAILAVLIVLAFRPQAVTVDAGESSSGPMQVTVRDEGRTRVRNEYVVSAPVGGRLLRFPYKPGAYVEAGQTIARIVPSDPAFLDVRARGEAQAAVRAAQAGLSVALAELERAEAQFQFARREEARIESLRERGLTSEESLDQARLSLRVAESALAAAQDSVGMREAELEAARARARQPGSGETDAEPVPLLAPVSGRVLRVAQESEAVIGPGSEVAVLGDPRDLEVVVEMLSTDAVQVKAGAEVIIEDSGLGEPLAGRVRLVEPYGFLKISALGVEEQRVNVIVDFTGPPAEWAAFGHGYRVEAAIVTWRAENVTQVPVAALFRRDGQWAVFRIAGGRAVLTPVEVGRNNGRSAEVISGIAPGEAVILYPGEEIEDGARVEPRR
jgi:HlyD family secretion protein